MKDDKVVCGFGEVNTVTAIYSRRRLNDRAFFLHGRLKGGIVWPYGSHDANITSGIGTELNGKVRLKEVPTGETFQLLLAGFVALSFMEKSLEENVTPVPTGAAWKLCIVHGFA